MAKPMSGLAASVVAMAGITCSCAVRASDDPLVQAVVEVAKNRKVTSTHAQPSSTPTCATIKISRLPMRHGLLRPPKRIVGMAER